jgi:hypothetical protein
LLDVMGDKSSAAGLPAIRRVAITVPPKHWFYGITGAFFSICRQSLIDLGCSVFEVPVDVFLPPDAARLPSLIKDVRSFRPEVAIGLHHGVNALLCRMPAERDGRRPNLFTDILELPTICIWDHEPIGLASQLLGPLPDHPAGSTAGAHKRLRDVLSHPLLLHCSRDTGQTRVMGELDLVDTSRVVQLGSTTLPGFAPPAGEPEFAAGGGPDVSFIGHFYETPAYGAPTLATLAQSCIAEWIERRDSALWDVLSHHIAGMPPSLMAQLKLDRDETYFWQFARRLIDEHAQTQLRLRMLGAAGVAVACYCGGYAPATDAPPSVTWMREPVAFGPELAALFARHPITVDVLNPNFMDGYSIKPLIGFAAGGFVLVNRTQDFIDAFGEVGAAVSYADAEELSDKIDRFLANPRKRRELGDAMRARIAAKHTLGQFFAKLLQETHRRGITAPSTGHNQVGPSNQAAKMVIDLLPALRTHPVWKDASVERRATAVVVNTSTDAWAYAAEIPMPALPQALREPHLRLTLGVEHGRIGICNICPQSGDLIAEQLVSATREPLSLTIELPADLSVTVILRNTIEGATRALITEATLCERVGEPA